MWDNKTNKYIPAAPTININSIEKRGILNELYI